MAIQYNPGINVERELLSGFWTATRHEYICSTNVRFTVKQVDRKEVGSTWYTIAPVIWHLLSFYYTADDVSLSALLRYFLLALFLVDEEKLDNK